MFNAPVDTSMAHPSSASSGANAGFLAAAGQTLRASRLVLDFMRLRTKAGRDRAGKASLQLVCAALFGLAFFIWAEVALFLSLRIAMAMHWAALLVFIFNGAGAIGVNAFFMRWRRVSESESLARQKREEASVGLRTARTELIGVKEQFLDHADELVRARILEPIDRYKLPISFALAFVTGILIARTFKKNPLFEPVTTAFPPKSR